MASRVCAVLVGLLVAPAIMTVSAQSDAELPMDMATVDRIVSAMDAAGVESAKANLAESLPWVLDSAPDGRTSAGLEDALRQSPQDTPSSIDLVDYVSALNGIKLPDILEYLSSVEDAELAAMADREIGESDSAALLGRTLRNFINVLSSSAGPVLLDDLRSRVQEAAQEGDVSAASDGEELAANISMSPAAAATLLDPRSKTVDEAARAAQMELQAIPEDVREKAGATLKNDLTVDSILQAISQQNPEEIIGNIRDVLSSRPAVFGTNNPKTDSLLQSITTADIEEISAQISAAEVDNVLQFFTSKF